MRNTFCSIIAVVAIASLAIISKADVATPIRERIAKDLMIDQISWSTLRLGAEFTNRTILEVSNVAYVQIGNAFVFHNLPDEQWSALTNCYEVKTTSLLIQK